MNILNSFFLTTIASLSTLLGCIFIFFKFKNIDKVIISSLSFSSGVMISISIFDLFFESIKLFNLNYNIFITIILFLIFFIIGILITMLIDKIPTNGNNLYKVGIVSMIGMMFHNFLEGMLTFVTSTIDINLGITIAFSIACHNIPEGISISIPIYYSTKSKIKAILYCFVSSLTEILGAFITYLFLYDYINDVVVAILLSIICSVMIYISIFEILKEVKEYKNFKLSFIFFMLGLIFMFISINN